MSENPEDYTVLAMPLNILCANQVIRGHIIIEGPYKGLQYGLLKDGELDPGGWCQRLYRLSEAPEDVQTINWFE